MQNHKDQCYKRNKLLQGNKKHNNYQGIAKKKLEKISLHIGKHFFFKNIQYEVK